jgi:hypothetical protein
MRLKVFCKIKENAHGYFNQARALTFARGIGEMIFVARRKFFARRLCLASA